MILGNSKEAYYELSGIASNVNRQIGFAGIAIIWIFCQVLNNKVLIPNELIIPTFLIAISLCFDLLQYIFGSVIWGSFHRYYEKKGKNDDSEVEASIFLNYPQNTCFMLKLLSMIIAYIFLFLYLYSNIELL